VASSAVMSGMSPNVGQVDDVSGVGVCHAAFLVVIPNRLTQTGSSALMGTGWPRRSASHTVMVGASMMALWSWSTGLPGSVGAGPRRCSSRSG